MTVIRRHSIEWDFGDRSLRTDGSRTLIMGILNVTPDSFSDGGRYDRLDAAVARAKQMVEEGADIIDVGGESTRPGHEQVGAEEEMRRVLPVIEAVSSQVKVPISIDTYKAAVAKGALQAGASIVNDVWGGLADPGILKIAAEAGCPIVLMHNRTDTDYADFVEDVLRDLQARVSAAKQAGVPDERILLDPGFGFAKSYEQNLKLMNRLDRVAELGYPVLLGTSRKSMIRLTIGGTPEQVVEGTIATTVMGIMKGCSIVRVHDVHAVRQAVRMTDAILERE